MIAIVWIKVEGKKRYSSWVAGLVQAFKTKPDTKENEIAVKLTLEIPDAIFEEPVFEANIKLPAVVRNLPERTEIARNVSAALSKELGYKVKIEIPEEKHESP